MKIDEGSPIAFKVLESFGKDGRREAMVEVLDETVPTGKSTYIGLCTFSESSVDIFIPEINQTVVVKFSPKDLYNLTKNSLGN